MIVIVLLPTWPKHEEYEWRTGARWRKSKEKLPKNSICTAYDESLFLLYTYLLSGHLSPFINISPNQQYHQDADNPKEYPVAPSEARKGHRRSDLHVMKISRLEKRYIEWGHSWG